MSEAEQKNLRNQLGKQRKVFKQGIAELESANPLSDNGVEPSIALFSGGGIRAQIGTMIAISELDKAGLSGSFQYNVGLSGGSWGITAAVYAKSTLTTMPANHRIDEMLKRFRLRANIDGEWGEMTEFKTKTCKHKCHEQWANSIRINLMTGYDDVRSRMMNEPDRDLSMTALTNMARQQGLPQPKFLVDIAKKVKLGRSIKHTGAICSIESPRTWCQLDVNEAGGTGNLEEEEVSFSTSHMRQVVKRIGTFRNTNVGTAFNRVWDYVAWSGSAWAEASVKLKGFIKKMEVRVVPNPTAYQAALRQGKDGKALTFRFADAGARCNLPLMELLLNHHRSNANMIKKVVMFDFTKKENLYSNLDKCCEETWPDSGITCEDKPYRNAGPNQIAKILNIYFVNALGGTNANPARVQVLFLPFRSLEVANFNQRYPTQKKLPKVGPHFWKPNDLDAYLYGYRPMVQQVYLPLINVFLA